MLSSKLQIRIKLTANEESDLTSEKNVQMKVFNFGPVEIPPDDGDSEVYLDLYLVPDLENNKPKKDLDSENSDSEIDPCDDDRALMRVSVPEAARGKSNVGIMVSFFNDTSDWWSGEKLGNITFFDPSGGELGNGALTEEPWPFPVFILPCDIDFAGVMECLSNLLSSKHKMGLIGLALTFISFTLWLIVIVPFSRCTGLGRRRIQIVHPEPHGQQVVRAEAAKQASEQAEQTEQAEQAQHTEHAEQAY